MSTTASNPVIEQRGAPASEADLQRLEARIGARLPADLRTFLAESDGALFAEWVRVGDTHVSSLMQIFTAGPTPVVNRTFDHVLTVYDERVPPGFLPFADDAAGNLVGVYVAGPNDGVHLWDHEMEADEGEPPRTDNLERLADSFSDFLAMLVIDDD